jgi:hypothetical protein
MSEQSHSQPPDASSLGEEARPAAGTGMPRKAPTRRATRRSQPTPRAHAAGGSAKEAELSVQAEAPVHADVRVRAKVPTRVDVVAPPDLATITSAYATVVGSVMPSLFTMGYHARAAVVMSVVTQLGRIVNPEPRPRRWRRPADTER